jgi:outer membrane lipoprotein carrier protein
MLVKDKVRAVVVIAVLCFVESIKAQPAVDRLERFFEEVRSLEAKFTQKVFGEDGRLVQASSGRVQIMRPGRFRWEYRQPDAQLILADGEKLWIYDSELEQATVKTIETALGAAPIMLLTGERPLADEFEIKPVERRDGLEWVKLRPKVQDTEFSRVILGLDEEGVKRMILHDQFGQTTVIRLLNVRTNAEISPDTFKFDPPIGTDVLKADG